MKKKSILRKLLLLTPIIILGLTLLFVNFAVRTFNDTAYTFMYNTNVQTVQSFSNELSMLTSQGYSSSEHGDLYSNMIHNFNTAVGAKDAIVTFMLDGQGQTYHSSAYNQAYVENLLQDGSNMGLVQAAYDSRGQGEIALAHPEGPEAMYYQRFYSGQDEYTLFLGVERAVIEKQLNADGVIIPLCVIGLLLLFALEYIIWLKLCCVGCGQCKLGSDPDGD